MGWHASHVRLLQAMGVHWISAAEAPEAATNDDQGLPRDDGAADGGRKVPLGRVARAAPAQAAEPPASPGAAPPHESAYETRHMPAPEHEDGRVPGRFPGRTTARDSQPDPGSRGTAVPTPDATSVPVRLADGFDRQAAEQRVAGLDWLALREAVTQCRACTLCETRRQTVFGVGDPAADWMVVGEAPGEQEDLKGEPFVGAAGRLLDQMLLSIGLARAVPETAAGSRAGSRALQGVYIANTLKCRPPGNRNPQPEELERCEPFLLRQIDLVQPRVILAMGRFAVQSLLRSTEPIGRLRGRVHRYHDVPLVVTYHPAYLLRNPVDKARAWEDLCLAASLSAPPRG